jgi:SAM-dependent methyltransferase
MPVRNPQPVDSPEFWKTRLDLAKKQGKLHYSVYLANDSLWDRIYDIHLGIFKKEIPKGAKVLDIGCGYGRMAQLFTNYTGIDISPDFIALAKELNPDKKFLVADLNHLPFKDKEFEVGFMVSVKGMIIGNLGEDAWKPMEAECKRVCKKVIVLEYGVYESHLDTHDTIAGYTILCDE